MQGVARDILSTRYVAVDPALPIERAEALLLWQQVEELFVTDAGGRLLGVLPDYAVLKWRLLPDGAQRVAEIMSEGIAVANPDTPLGEIAARLRVHVHARIPIVDGGRLVGVVTRRALLQRLADSRPETPPVCAAARRDGLSPVVLAAPNFLKKTNPAGRATVLHRSSPAGDLDAV